MSITIMIHCFVLEREDWEEERNPQENNQQTKKEKLIILSTTDLSRYQPFYFPGLMKCAKQTNLTYISV